MPGQATLPDTGYLIKRFLHVIFGEIRLLTGNSSTYGFNRFGLTDRDQSYRAWRAMVIFFSLLDELFDLCQGIPDIFHDLGLLLKFFLTLKVTK